MVRIKNICQINIFGGRGDKIIDNKFCALGQ